MNSKCCFKEVMTRLGENDSVDDDLCRTLGKCVCTMYCGGHAKGINAVRFNQLTVKQNRENKYVGLLALLPCQATLKLHNLRANKSGLLDEKILSCTSWRTTIVRFQLGSWRKIIWIEEAYPVLPRCCCLTAIILMKDMKRTLMSILEMIVSLTNMIEIQVTFAILNLLGPFLFVWLLRNIPNC